MRALKALLGMAALTALLLAAAGSAAAKDRNGDRIPDRWEKRNDLSLRVNQARRDQDRDGLRNRAEFRARTDPRDADSDEDGTEDGDEGAGKVVSYDPETGELVINLFGGGTVSGLVTDETRIRCGCRGTDDEYEPGEDEGEEPEEETLRHPGPGGRLEGGRGHRDDRLCSTDELVEDAAVSEAELTMTADGLVFSTIELVRQNPDGEDDGEGEGEGG